MVSAETAVSALSGWIRLLINALRSAVLKRLTVLCLFLFVVILNASAQAFRETRIFVPPIDGSGILDDMAFFYKGILGEIDKQHRTIGRTRRTSDYVITGRLMPITADLRSTLDLPPGSIDEYVLYLELFNNAIDEVIGNQYITYYYPDETTQESLAVIMYYLLSSVPDLVPSSGSDDDDETWRHKWVYLNLNFVWTPRVYIAEQQSVNIAAVGAEAMLNIHPFRFLSIKAGAKVSQEWVVIYQSGRAEDSQQDMILEFPAAIAFVARLQHNIMLEPYVGGSFNISMLGSTKPNPLSWMAGVQLSLKAGFGSITFDPRFSMDFGQSNIVDKTTSEDMHPYWRYTVHLGIGYKVGFFNRKM